MRSWFIRIVPAPGHVSFTVRLGRVVPAPGHTSFTVEGMEVECDGYTDEVSDFDTWGTFPTFAEAVACRDNVLENYHKAMPWTDYAQELCEGSLR